MKKTLFLTAALVTVLIPAQADTIANWTFETSGPSISGTSATFGPIAPEIGSGTASGVHASGATVWSSPVGNGSIESWSVNTWAVGDYFQFQVSTVGFSDISVSYDQTSSGTGPRDFTFSFSTDGSVFTPITTTNVLANASPNPTWNSGTYNAVYTFNFGLSGISALNNASTAFFRLTDASTTSANGGTVAVAGTDRIDNFVVTATAVPEPSTYALLGLAGLALAIRRRKV